MAKKFSFYISNCKIIMKDTDTIQKKRRRGWFKSEYVPVNKYYVYCEPPEDAIRNLVFRIEIDEEKYNRTKIGADVSVHIEAKYEYACFHDLIEKKTEKEIMKCVEDS